MTLVVDASMAIAWLFRDEQNEAAGRALDQVAADGAIVPALWRLEVANVLRSSVRRQRCDENFADRALAVLGRLPIAVDQETDVHAWGGTRALSREEGLTTYDAAYLELALRRRLPLASKDQDLLAAARRRGVSVIAA